MILFSLSPEEAGAEWNKALMELKKVVPESEYLLWVADIGFRFANGKIYLLTLTPYDKKYFEETYRDIIAQALSSTGLAGLEIVVTHEDPTATGVQENTPVAAAIKAVASLRPTLQHQKKPKQAQQTQLSLLPTNFCRTTPFSSGGTGTLRPIEEIVENFLIETSWGSLTYTGPDCGMDEEDVLIRVLLMWIRAAYAEKFYFTYADLLDGLGYTRDGNGRHYSRNTERVKESLDRLSAVSLRIENKGQKRSQRIGLIKHGADDAAGKFWVRVDPEFGKSVDEGFITGLEGREMLKHSFTKALHRFLSSHRDDIGRFRLPIIAQALRVQNLSPDTLRRYMNRALNELKAIDFLSADSKVRQGFLHYHRKKSPLSGPKLLAKIRHES